MCLCPRWERCSRYIRPSGGASEPGTAQCRYDTPDFAIGISHTVIFLEDETQRLCQQQPVHLSQHCKMSVHR